MNNLFLSLRDPLQIIGLRLQSWFELFVANVPNIFLAILILVGWYFTRSFVTKMLTKVFSYSKFSSALKSLIYSLFGLLYFGLMAVIALTVVGLDKAVISLLAGLGVVGIAMGFAFQDLASNFVSGIMIALRSPYKVGDLIEIDNKVGNVEKIRLRETVLEGFQGQKIYIPNKDFIKMHFLNFSEKGQRRVLIDVGVAYDSDLEKVQKTIRKELESLDFISKDFKPQVYFDSFGSSSINIKVIFWIKYPTKNYLMVKSEGIKSVKKCLDSIGVEIPYPIRSIRVPNKIKLNREDYSESESCAHA